MACRLRAAVGFRLSCIVAVNTYNLEPCKRGFIGSPQAEVLFYVLASMPSPPLPLAGIYVYVVSLDESFLCELGAIVLH